MCAVFFSLIFYKQKIDPNFQPQARSRKPEPTNQQPQANNQQPQANSQDPNARFTLHTTT